MPYFFVDFFGYLMDADHSRLSENAVYYVHGRSETKPGVVRTGLARNLVRIEADDANAALESVITALGAKAADCSEWNVRDAPDEEVVRDPWA